MKIGLNMLLWTTDVGSEHYPLLHELKRAGYDGVELPVFQRDDRKGSALARELDAAGLERTAVTVMSPEANPIDPDPSVRRAAVQHLKEILAACGAMGVKVLCGPMHSPVGCRVGRGPSPDEWKRAVEVLQEAGPAAERCGVLMAIEPLNRFETYFLNTAADTRRLVDDVGHPWVRAMYDTFHANIEERDVSQAIAAVAPVLAHVHISENHRGTPGTGLVQWDESFAALKSAGYDGWLNVEAFGRALPDLAAATCIWRDVFDSESNLARDSLAFIRRHWAAA